MTNDLIDFIRGARGAITIDQAASELHQLGKHGAAWPRASAVEWKRELLRLVDEGELVLDGETLTVAKKEEMRQGELF